MKNYYIDYYSAVHWLNGDLILFNNIHEIDPDFFFELYREDENGDLGDPIDIFQYFLTNYSGDDVKWMQKTFPQLHFAFSSKLDLWVLGVDHYGTSWDYVWTRCEIDWLKDTDFNIKGEYEYRIENVKTAKFMMC